MDQIHYTYCYTWFWMLYRLKSVNLIWPFSNLYNYLDWFLRPNNISHICCSKRGVSWACMKLFWCTNFHVLMNRTEQNRSLFGSQATWYIIHIFWQQVSVRFTKKHFTKQVFQQKTRMMSLFGEGDQEIYLFLSLTVSISINRLNYEICMCIQEETSDNGSSNLVDD